MSDEQYDTILRTATGSAAATGPLVVLPVPGPDLLAMGGIWSAMMVAIARRNGRTLDAESARRIALSVFAGAGAYWMNTKTFFWFVGKVPGIGMLAGSAANGMINATYTLWLGFSLIDLFEQEGDSADMAFYISFLQEAMKLGPNTNKLRRIAAFIKRCFG